MAVGLGIGGGGVAVGLGVGGGGVAVGLGIGGGGGAVGLGVGGGGVAVGLGVAANSTAAVGVDCNFEVEPDWAVDSTISKDFIDGSSVGADCSPPQFIKITAITSPATACRMFKLPPKTLVAYAPVGPPVPLESGDQADAQDTSVRNRRPRE